MALPFLLVPRAKQPLPPTIFVVTLPDTTAPARASPRWRAIARRNAEIR